MKQLKIKPGQLHIFWGYSPAQLGSGHFQEPEALILSHIAGEHPLSCNLEVDEGTEDQARAAAHVCGLPSARVGAGHFWGRDSVRAGQH